MQFLIADILEETRNSSSTSYSNLANRTSKANQPNSDNKESEDKGNYKGNNFNPNYNKKKRQNQENSRQADFACLNFSMNSKEIEENNSSDSESEVEDLAKLIAEAKLTKKASKNESKADITASKNHFQNHDGLLYDTGSTIHIINNKKWFLNFTPSKNNLGVIYTGGGPVIPEGSGTAEFEVLINFKKKIYCKLRLKNALYCSKFTVNIISGLLYYKANGYINGFFLKDNNNNPLALLYPEKYGFFLQIKGIEPPVNLFNKVNIIGYNPYKNPSYLANSSYLANYEIEVQIPVLTKERADEFKDYRSRSPNRANMPLETLGYEEESPRELEGVSPIGDPLEEKGPVLPIEESSTEDLGLLKPLEPIATLDPDLSPSYIKLIKLAILWH